MRTARDGIGKGSIILVLPTLFRSHLAMGAAWPCDPRLANRQALRPWRSGDRARHRPGLDRTQTEGETDIGRLWRTKWPDGEATTIPALQALGSPPGAIDVTRQDRVGDTLAASSRLPSPRALPVTSGRTRSAMSSGNVRREPRAMRNETAEQDVRGCRNPRRVHRYRRADPSTQITSPRPIPRAPILSCESAIPDRST